MKKLLVIIYVILIVVFVKLVLTYWYNEKNISEYNAGKYDELKAQDMLVLNFYQPYIAHYNYSNILFKKGDYDGAIQEYKTALNAYPPKYKECDIRINLALSILNKINDVEQTSEAMSILDQAEDILCEKGCANKEDDNGHSQKAEELQALIEQLRNMLQKEITVSDPKQEPKEQPEEKPEDLDDKQKQLQDIQTQGIEERTKTMENYRAMDEDDGVYYNGKRW